MLFNIICNLNICLNLFIMLLTADNGEDIDSSVRLGQTL